MLGEILGSLGSSIIGQGIASRDKQDTYNKQINLLNLQNAYNTDMWYKTNAYNSPSSLYNRLKSMGMSPGAAMQAAAGINGNASQVSSAGVPGVSGMDPSLKNLFGDFGRSIAEIENIKADTRQKNADAKRNEDTLYYDIQNLIATNNKFKAEYDKIQADMELTNEQKKYQSILNKYADKKSQEEIKAITEAWKKTQADTQLVNQEKRKLIWENFFRDQFGIDPHDNAMTQLVQASLRGDMSNVLVAFEKTANILWEKGKEWLTDFTNNVKDKIDKVKDEIKINNPWIEKSLKSRFNPFSYGYESIDDKGNKIYVSKLKERNGKIYFR